MGYSPWSHKESDTTATKHIYCWKTIFCSDRLMFTLGNIQVLVSLLITGSCWNQSPQLFTIKKPCGCPLSAKLSQFERPCCHSALVSQASHVLNRCNLASDHRPADAGGSILSTNHDLEIPMMSPTTNQGFWLTYAHLEDHIELI